VVDLPDKAGVEELFDLFTDEVLPLNGSRMVLNRQANTSTLAWRKATSVSSYLLSRSPMMQVV
jgi:hypothetical protein